MDQNNDLRSLSILHLALAAAALALVSALGQTSFAAERPAIPDGRTSLAQPGCTLCIVGTPSIQWNGSSGSFHVGRVENRTHGPTSFLALRVELQSTYPDPMRDSGVGDYEFSDRVPLKPLAKGESHSNIDSGTIGFHAANVPAGEYWMLVVLLDLEPSWPHFDDYAVMNDRVSCDGTACVVTSSGPCPGVPLPGTWGYTWSGTFILPTGPTPAAAAGTLTVDATGQVTGTQTSSVGGVVGEDTLRGTLTVKGNCTGTMTVGLYDPSDNLLRSAVWAVVYVDGGKELRGIFKSLVLPNGTSVPTIATAEGKTVFESRR